MLYCIKCERMVKAEQPKICPMGHLLEQKQWIEANLTITEIEYCCFDDGWAFNPPPPNEADPYLMSTYDWMLWVAQSIPSLEELTKSNINADFLRRELEGDDL